MLTSTEIQANLAQIQADIQKYAPEPSSVTLVGASKNRTAEEIDAAVAAGLKIIGENRVQEAKDKFPALASPVQKHFIGHLQRNKVKVALEFFDLIESVDSLRLAEKINQEAEKMNRQIPIFIEVNISEDPAKHGIPPEETENFIQTLQKMPNLTVQGLMTIGKLTERPEDRRPYFREFYQLHQQIQQNLAIKLPFLSMGMSQDYQIALEESSNLIRLGTAIWGPRSCETR